VLTRTRTCDASLCFPAFASAFGDEVVRGGLDGRRQPSGWNLDDLDREHRALGEAGQRRLEPAVGEQARVEAADELADLFERQRQLRLRRRNQLRHLGRVGLEPALDQVQVERNGHEPLLGTVVQVSLDAAALGVARGHDPRARVGHVTHRAAQLGDVAHDRNDLVGAGRSDTRLELALVPEAGAEGVLDRRQPALVERRPDALHQRLGDVRGQQLMHGRADDPVGHVDELRRVAADLEVRAVRP
jgi:hypothetical protein